MKTTFDIKDKISEIISILLLVSSAGLISISLRNLPDTIPIHFDFNGKADGYGSKYTLWFTFGISTVLYSILTFLSRFPKFYKNNITKNNVEAQYILTAKMLRSLKVIVMLLFLVITILVIRNAQLKTTEIFNYLIFLVLGLIFPMIIYYLIQFNKIR